MNSRPNIILIICDQLRYDALGCSGNPGAETPNLDDLAARGMVFDRAYSACPSCIPARASLMTGLDQWHAGILGMGRGQPLLTNRYRSTLAGELTRSGYQSVLVGKGHFEPQNEPMGFEQVWLEEGGRQELPDGTTAYRQWFDRQVPAGVTPEDHGVDWNSWMARPWHLDEHLHHTAWTASRAWEAIRDRDPARPLFLNLSFVKPHSPYVPPQYFFDLHRRNPRLPDPVVGDWCERYRAAGVTPSVSAWRGELSPDRVRRARVGYYGEVSFLDSRIGFLLNYCRRYAPEFWRRSWIVFCSDHGDMLGDHYLWRKTYAYEGSSRIPLFICPPAGSEFAAGRDGRHVAELRDLMPTMLEIAGAAVPDGLDGRSLLPLLRGERPPWREWLHGEHNGCYGPEQEMQFVTDGRVKFVWLPRLGVEQFFDLERDPGECRNLVADPARAAEVAAARRVLIETLAARDCDWCRDGELQAPPEPLFSPWAATGFPGRP